MNRQEREKNSNRDYWIFISYSHADKESAVWLHRKLESYKIPEDLIGKPTSKGVVPRSFERVFRDEDELAAKPNLLESLYSALENSRNLIVICSPNSARSPTVNKEVVHFKKTHGEANVSCLIVGGIPFASSNGLAETDECFCPALRFEVNRDGSHGRATIPLAADRRELAEGSKPHGNRKEVAFLKLVAGVLGVDFDELYRRDRRRRLKRALAIGGASVFGLSCILGLALRLEEVRRALQKTTAAVNRMDETTHREFGKLPRDRINFFQKRIQEARLEALFDNVAKEVQATEERAKQVELYTQYARKQVALYVQKRRLLQPKIDTLLEKLKPSEGWAAYRYQYTHGCLSARELVAQDYEKLSNEDKGRVTRLVDQSHKSSIVLGEVQSISREIDEVLSIVSEVRNIPPIIESLPIENGNPQLYNRQPSDFLKGVLYSLEKELLSSSESFEEKIIFEDTLRRNWPRLMDLENNLSSICGGVWRNLDKIRAGDWKRAEIDTLDLDNMIEALDNYLLFTVPARDASRAQPLSVDVSASMQMSSLARRLRLLLAGEWK